MSERKTVSEEEIREKIGDSITFCSDFLCIPPDVTQNSASAQFDTFLKIRHDFWLIILSMSLNKVEIETGNLKPDIVYSMGSKLYFGEVSFTLDANILQQKREKYSQLGDVRLSSLSLNEIELDTGLPFMLTLKKRYILETSILIHNFIEGLKSLGIHVVDITEYSLDTPENYKKELNWPVSKMDGIAWGSKRRLNQDISGYNDQELLDEISGLTAKLMEDPEIQQLHSLKPVELGEFTKIFNEIKAETKKFDIEGVEYKPLIMFPAIISSKFSNWHDFKILEDFSDEQDLILKQMSILSKIENPFQAHSQKFVEDMKSDLNSSIFRSGLPPGIKDEPLLRSMYQQEKKERLAMKKAKEFTSSKFEGLSFQQFCLSRIGQPSNTEIQAYSRKTILLKPDFIKPEHQGFFQSSKTHMSKKDYIDSKINKMESAKSNRQRKCVSLDRCKGEMEEFIEELTHQMDVPYLPESIHRLFYPIGPDLRMLNDLKAAHLEEFSDFIKKLSKTNLLGFGDKVKRNIDQLTHYQGLNLKKGYFSFFNSGSRDFLFVVEHGLQDLGHDVGKAFFVVKFGRASPLEEKIFGFKFHYGSNKGGYISLTGWRRLPSSRLVFHSDQFFSTLSTSFMTYIRNFSTDTSDNERNLNIKSGCSKTLAFRMIVGFTHSQKTAELLSDFRYLYMDAFSDFSNTREFVMDKYVKPYRNVMDHYIVTRIPEFDLIRRYYRSGNILFKKPGFFSGKRESHTMGGLIKLPSVLQKGYWILCIQDLLDEMFIYVHTNKEPSSQYHEFVNAMNTIKEYQSKYDKHGPNRKLGSFMDYSELKYFLLTDNKVGFWNKATYLAGKTLQETSLQKNLESLIIEQIKQDTILDMNSTKSIIPEIKRSISINTLDDITINSGSSRSTNRVKKKQKELWKILEDTSSHFSKVNSELGIPGLLSSTNRCKVHDSTLNIIERYNFTRVFELAAWNIESNNSRVLTDICIKAQYGAKREFYVINHGAKAMARTLENIFKVVCKNQPDEMISVPGDSKMYNIQNKIDKIYEIDTNDNMRIFYCNGDCTKWSAAETMECLASFVEGSRDLIGDESSDFSLNVLDAWGKKTIQIPTDLAKNIYYKKDSLITYTETMEFKSTQNFLQGMFNYLSSAKAVACSNLTYKIWKRIRPESKLILQHLEHSDDYCLMIICQDEEEFRQFKLCHRIVMRFCGINDSTKKTNCQSFLLEFISLISFNGVTVYPQIKKIKEVGLNIGCLGYSSDIKTTCSRIGEAMRVGVPSSAAYIMQRIQNVRISESYGIFTHNKECFRSSNTSRPIELWGMPDCHPILYLITSGDPDSLRLWRFGTENTRNELMLLYQLQSDQNGKEVDGDYNINSVECCKLYHPPYSFLKETKLLNRIKKMMSFTLEDSIKYWDEHYFDLYLKPRDPDRMARWLKSKYFQASFGEAYMRQGRAQMQLRMSHFVAQKCLTVSQLTSENQRREESYTISEFMVMFYNRLSDQQSKYECSEDQTFQMVLYGFDPRILKTYNYLNGSSYHIDKPINTDARAFMEPKSQNEFSCVGNPINILQFMFSPEDAKNDGRRVTNLNVMMKDIETIRALVLSFPGDTEEEKFWLNKDTIRQILQSSKMVQKPMILRFNPQNDFLKLLHGLIERHTYPSVKLNLITRTSDEFASRYFEVDEKTYRFATMEPNIEDWTRFQPYLVADIIMLMFILKDVERDKIFSILNKIRSKITGLSVKETVRQLSKAYLEGNLQLENKEQQILAAVSDYVCDDPEPLSKFLKTKLGYTYKYKSTAEKKRHRTIIHLKLMGDFYIAEFDESKVSKLKSERRSDGDIGLYCRTNTRKIHLLGWAYNVILRLAGLISLNELIKRSNFVIAPKLPFQYHEGCTEGLRIYQNCFNQRFTIVQDIGDDIETPFFLTELHDFEESKVGDQIHQLGNFDIKRFSCFSGFAKVFTLDPSKLHQSDTWTYGNGQASIYNILLSNKFMERLLSSSSSLAMSSDLKLMNSICDTSPGVEDFTHNLNLKTNRRTSHKELDEQKVSKKRKKLEETLSLNRNKIIVHEFGNDVNLNILDEYVNEINLSKRKAEEISLEGLVLPLIFSTEDRGLLECLDRNWFGKINKTMKHGKRFVLPSGVQDISDISAEVELWMMDVKLGTKDFLRGNVQYKSDKDSLRNKEEEEGKDEDDESKKNSFTHRCDAEAQEDFGFSRFKIVQGKCYFSVEDLLQEGIFEDEDEASEVLEEYNFETNSEDILEGSVEEEASVTFRECESLLELLSSALTGIETEFPLKNSLDVEKILNQNMEAIRDFDLETKELIHRLFGEHIVKESHGLCILNRKFIDLICGKVVLKKGNEEKEEVDQRSRSNTAERDVLSAMQPIISYDFEFDENSEGSGSDIEQDFEDFFPAHEHVTGMSVKKKHSFAKTLIPQSIQILDEVVDKLSQKIGLSLLFKTTVIEEVPQETIANIIACSSQIVESISNKFIRSCVVSGLEFIMDHCRRSSSRFKSKCCIIAVSGSEYVLMRSRGAKIEDGPRLSELCSKIKEANAVWDDNGLTVQVPVNEKDIDFVLTDCSTNLFLDPHMSEDIKVIFKRYIESLSVMDELEELL